VTVHCAASAGTLRHQCRYTAPPVPVHCATSAGHCATRIVVLNFFMFFQPHISPVIISAYFINKEVFSKIKIVCVVRLQRVYAQFFFLAQKSNQNTWFSATLVFSLDFHWFSAVSPTLCTVISKKTKLSCFGGFFSLVF
jgi:hypothetical protein